MRKIAIGFLLTAAGAQSLADECTSKITQYIDGVLRPVKSEKYVSQDKVIWAEKEVGRVTALRQQMRDCDVAQRISLMSQTDNAVAQNNRQVAELEKSGKQGSKPKHANKAHLYRY